MAETKPDREEVTKVTTKPPKYNHKSTDPDGQFGCGPSCSPSSLQWIRWPPLMIVYLCIVGTSMFLNNIYFSAVLPTIERRFGLSSSQSGFLTVIDNLSGVVFGLFLSYLAERTSRPMVFAFSIYLLIFGNICFTLPHFLSEPLDVGALLAGKVIAGPSSTGNETLDLCSIAGDIQSSTTDAADTCKEEPVGFRGPIWWIVIGQVVTGIGQATSGPIIVPYLDDLAGRYRQRFVIYYTIYNTAFVAAPSVGFIVAGTALEYYVDFDRIPEDEIPSELPLSDPRWIGAWWLGFAAFAAILIIVALPMAFLPKDPSVNYHARQVSDGKDADNSDGKQRNKSRTNKTPGFLTAMKMALRRPLLLLFASFRIIEAATIAMYLTFTVKYLTIEFGISGKYASYLNSIISAPASFLGIYVAAFISRKITLKKCGVYIIVNNIITIVLLACAIFVGCQNPAIAGVNREYIVRVESMDMMNCNYNCNCDSNVFRPVCGSDNISYISPCNAGCEVQLNDTMSSGYDKCTCVQQSTADHGAEFGSATPGLCAREEGCETKLYITLVLFALLVFCRFQDNAPINQIVLANVEPEIRTTAYGFARLVYTLIGWFPNPIYFGAIINATCVLWQYACGQRASCWLYDIVSLRYAFFGTNIALRVLQIPLSIGIMMYTKESLNETSEDDVQMDEKKGTISGNEGASTSRDANDDKNNGNIENGVENVTNNGKQQHLVA